MQASAMSQQNAIESFELAVSASSYPGQIADSVIFAVDFQGLTNIPLQLYAFFQKGYIAAVQFGEANRANSLFGKHSTCKRVRQSLFTLFRFQFLIFASSADTTRQLHGIFRAETDGTYDLKPDGWHHSFITPLPNVLFTLPNLMLGILCWGYQVGRVNPYATYSAA